MRIPVATWKAAAMFRDTLFLGTALCFAFTTSHSGKNANYIWNQEINPLNLPAGARTVINPIDTSFSCSGRPYGYYVDVLNKCQIFHVCDPNTKQKFSFFCPKYTAFDPEVSVCTYRGIKTCGKIVNYGKDQSQDSDSSGSGIKGSGDSSQDSDSSGSGIKGSGDSSQDSDSSGSGIKGSGDSSQDSNTKGISSGVTSHDSGSEGFVTYDNEGDYNYNDEDFSSESVGTDDGNKDFGFEGDSDFSETPRYVSMPTEAPSSKDNPLNLPAGVHTVIKKIDTSFSCIGRIYGYYADVLNECKIFHVCDPVSNRKFSFFCPQHTVFDQATLVCTYPGWGVPCHKATHYYHVNERFGKISPPGTVGNQQPEILQCLYPVIPWKVLPNPLENPTHLSFIEKSATNPDDASEFATTNPDDASEFNLQHVIEK